MGLAHFLTLAAVAFPCLSPAALSQPAADDAAAMQAMKSGITNLGSLDWSDPNPCKWSQVQCDPDNRVTKIQIGGRGLEGTLHPDLNSLTNLEKLEVMSNKLTGPVPSLAGLGSLQVLLLNQNSFSSLPSDVFSGMTSLQAVDVGDNPLLSAWEVPDGLKDAALLVNFSASYANVVGPIPEFFGGEAFPGLERLHLAGNPLEGPLPASFAGSRIQSLWLNNYKPNSKLNGTIEVLSTMTELTELYLHGNHFTGPIPDLSPVTGLSILGLRDNELTGIVPVSLVALKSLKTVNLTNNYLQGPPPKFDTTQVQVDMIQGHNSFCTDQPGLPCDPRVDVLLSVAESMNYPLKFAQSWVGNDPCNEWVGLTCMNNETAVVNMPAMGLSGTISPRFSEMESLMVLIVSNNSLSGTIPSELTALSKLILLDVSNNNLSGEVPKFTKSNLVVKTAGNPLLGGNAPPETWS